MKESPIPITESHLIGKEIVKIRRATDNVNISQTNFPSIYSQYIESEQQPPTKIQTFTTKALSTREAIEAMGTVEKPLMLELILFQKILTVIPSEFTQGGKGYDLNCYQRTGVDNPNINLLTAYYLVTQTEIDSEISKPIKSPQEIEELAEKYGFTEENGMAFDLMALRRGFAKLVSKDVVGQLLETDKMSQSELNLFFEAVADWQYMITRHIVETQRRFSDKVSHLFPFQTLSEEEFIPYPQFIPYMGQFLIRFVQDLPEIINGGVKYEPSDLFSVSKRYDDIFVRSVKYHLMLSIPEYKNELAKFDQALEASKKNNGTRRKIQRDKMNYIESKMARTTIKQLFPIAERNTPGSTKNLQEIYEAEQTILNEINKLHNYYLDNPHLLKKSRAPKPEPEENTEITEEIEIPEEHGTTHISLPEFSIKPEENI
ncbi:hypothetical protein C4577_02660 [Candidatus Parcubacteria bacterium]|nr:MAG: hypothetical protein C4577_02660 [Candidatus Parcubacteria bacterium]